MTTTSDTATSPAHLMELFADRAAGADMDGVMALYEPEAVFQPEFGVQLVGQEQIRAGLSQLLALNPKIRYVGQPEVIMVGDTALVANVWEMTGVAPDGTAVSDGGTSADVVRRQSDGRWLVLIDQPRGNPQTP